MAIAFRALASTGTSAAATSVVIAKPSGTADGDRLVAFIETTTEASVGVQTGPAGWTNLVSNNQNTGVAHNQQCWVKTATGSEPADYTWSTTGSTAWAGIILAYSGVGNTGATASGADSTRDTTLTHDGVTTTTNNAVVLYSYAANESSPPVVVPMTAHASTTKQGEVNSTVSAVGMAVMVAEEARATAGATGARNATSSANTRNTWIGVELVESAGGGGGALLKKLLLG